MIQLLRIMQFDTFRLSRCVYVHIRPARRRCQTSNEPSAEGCGPRSLTGHKKAALRNSAAQGSGAACSWGSREAPVRVFHWHPLGERRCQRKQSFSRLSRLSTRRIRAITLETYTLRLGGGRLVPRFCTVASNPVLRGHLTAIAGPTMLTYCQYSRDAH